MNNLTQVEEWKTSQQSPIFGLLDQTIQPETGRYKFHGICHVVCQYLEYGKLSVYEKPEDDWALLKAPTGNMLMKHADIFHKAADGLGYFEDDYKKHADAAFLGACKGGQLELVNRIVQLFHRVPEGGTINFNLGLIYACSGGHLELADRIVSLGTAFGITLSFNSGLNRACSGGYLKLANRMVRLGANDFDWGLYEACSKGHLELVNRMIELGATAFNWGLAVACSRGNLELVNRMIELGANDFDWGLAGACYKGHLELVNRMIELGATECSNSIHIH